MTERTSDQATHGSAVATDRGRAIPAAIGCGSLVALALGVGMVWRAEARTNKTSLADRPRSVSIVVAKEASFQPVRTYVGTLLPWVEANVGPQLAAGYVETVAVRPGDRVKRGDVLATLDCRSARSSMAAVAREAQAIEKNQHALAAQAQRTSALLDGGFVSSNEVDQELARSGAEAARLDARRENLTARSLEVSDCVLRAPFDGEIGTRWIDPGAFVRPGAALVSVVDRSRIRFSADVPEVDFAIVAPGTAVRLHIPAVMRDTVAGVARRAPNADGDTRTIHFEVDLEDAAREIPVGTTAEARLDVGSPLPATEIPLLAATVRGARATLFLLEGDIAHAITVPVLGELGGSLFVARSLPPATLVVTEGRTLIHEGDRVDLAKARAAALAATSAAAGSP